MWYNECNTTGYTIYISLKEVQIIWVIGTDVNETQTRDRGFKSARIRCTQHGTMLTCLGYN